MTLRSMSKMGPDRDANLGLVQIQVLASLAQGDRTVGTLARDWPGLLEGSVRSAITSLGRRGLVDAVRFKGNERVWGLTHRGRKVVRVRWGDGDELIERIEQQNGGE